MDDPRQQLISRLDPTESRVKLSSAPIVLLFGGKAPEKASPEAEDPPLKSLRHALMRVGGSVEFIVPENITDWLGTGGYENLLQLELDLAAISALIVIVVESAGSIAELGAFSQVDQLREKLFVIRSSRVENRAQSFIELGIVREITKRRPKAARSYPWEICANGSPVGDIADIVENILLDVEGALAEVPKAPLFDANDGTHVMSLISCFVHLFTAMKEKEIIQILSKFGVDIDAKDLRRKLFLLERFGFVIRAEYSDSVFYIRGKEKLNNFHIGQSGEAKLDIPRFEFDCLEFYRANKKQERHRIGALRAEKIIARESS